jgi:hypothetical protein
MIYLLEVKGKTEVFTSLNRAETRLLEMLREHCEGSGWTEIVSVTPNTNLRNRIKYEFVIEFVGGKKIFSIRATCGEERVGVREFSEALSLGLFRDELDDIMYQISILRDNKLGGFLYYNDRKILSALTAGRHKNETELDPEVNPVSSKYYKYFCYFEPYRG